MSLEFLIGALIAEASGWAILEGVNMVRTERTHHWSHVGAMIAFLSIFPTAALVLTLAILQR